MSTALAWQSTGVDGDLRRVESRRPGRQHRRRGDSAGGTAEMLAFCAEHGITADVGVPASSSVNKALNRLEDGDVRYRFVLDMSDLDQPEAQTS